MGAVRTPGYVELKGDPTLTRALSQAGYPTPESGSYMQITHEAPAARTPQWTRRGPTQERIPRLEIENGRASRIRLRPGDSVFVPNADKFYITGEVKTVGQLVLSQETTVQQAIIMAGGADRSRQQGSGSHQPRRRWQDRRDQGQGLDAGPAGRHHHGREADFLTTTRAMRVLHLCAGNLYGGVERIVSECASDRHLCPAMSPSFAVVLRRPVVGGD